MSLNFFSELKRRNVLRVATAYVAVSWLLIQVAETIFPLYGLADSASRLVVTMLAIGFFPVVVLAWAFEWTAGGIRLDSDTADAARGDNRWLDRTIVVTLMIAVSYFAVDKFVLDPARDREREQDAVSEALKEATLGSYGDKSIAVLPFRNLSDDPDQEFFALGISEDLLNLLARIPELRVISRTSSFELSNKGLDIPDIAGRLDVAHVLEGSVRKAGTRLRITAQLIEGATDTHIWSESWDRDFGDIFQIQDEIAAEVIQRLKIILVDEMPRSIRTDPVAYALTLQAKEVMNQNDNDVEKRAITILQQALDLDPDYVDALLWLNYAAWQSNWLAVDGDERMAQLEREAYARLVEVAPDDPRVIARLGWEQFEIEHDWPAAAATLNRALTLGPGYYDTLRTSAVFARMIGRFDTAVTLFDRAFRVDPLCTECPYHLMRTNYLGRHFDAALRWYDTFRETGRSGGSLTLAKIHLFRGDPDLALALATEAPDAVVAATIRVMALHDLGREDESRSALQDLVTAADWGSARGVAEAAAWIGDSDTAFHWIGVEFGPDYQHFFMAATEPALQNLHDDPRWQVLLRKVRLTDEQRAAIDFDPQLPDWSDGANDGPSLSR